MNFNFKNLMQVFLGKRKERSQMCMVITPDGRIVPREIPVLMKCIVEESAFSAHLIDEANQIKDEKTGLWYQVVTENTCTPLTFFRERDYTARAKKDDKNSVSVLWDLIRAVFHESWVVNLILTNKKLSAKTRFLNRVTYICGVPIVSLPIIVVLKMFVMK